MLERARQRVLGEKPAVHTKCRARRDVEPRENVSRDSFFFFSRRAEEMTTDTAVAAATVFEGTQVCLQPELCTWKEELKVSGLHTQKQTTAWSSS